MAAAVYSAAATFPRPDMPRMVLGTGRTGVTLERPSHKDVPSTP